MKLGVLFVTRMGVLEIYALVLGHKFRELFFVIGIRARLTFASNNVLVIVAQLIADFAEYDLLSDKRRSYIETIMGVMCLKFGS